MDTNDDLPATLARGLVSGLAGTAVMTGFQLLVEMPLTKRKESFAPAALFEKLLPIAPRTRRGRRQLNFAAHFSLGAGWGVARAAAARAGLRGQPAVAAVFAGMYPLDVLTATALGVYKPSTWSAQGLAIDLVDKLVQAQATGLVFDALAKTPDTPAGSRP